MPKRKAEVELTKDGEPDEEEQVKAEDGDDSEENDSSDEGAGEGDEESEEDEDEDESGSEDSFPEASSSGEESEDDEEGEAYKEIDVNFEFFDPKESDFLGLKALLNTYLDGQQYDCSGLVDAIIKQASAVGTVVKSAEDDDPFAIMTAFNTAGAHKGDAWLGELRTYLRARCPDEATRAKLDQAFAGPGTGLLVSERLINCPPQLAPPLLQFLMEEIEGAATDEDFPQSERDEFAFARYLHVTRVYADTGEEAEEDADAAADGAAGPGPSAPARPAAGRKGKKGKAPVIVYVRPEDEYLQQVASWSFTFPVEGRPVAKGDLVPLRAVMCVEARRVGEARGVMDLVVGNAREGGGAGGGAGGKAGGGGGAKEGKQAAAGAGGKGREGAGKAGGASGQKRQKGGR